jgi:hypothetical protein
MRKDLKVKAIPVPEGSDHPEPPHLSLIHI